MSTAQLHVACAVEGDEYLAHTAAMLHSALASTEGARMHVHLLHGPDICARQEEQLAEMVIRNGGEISYLRVADAEVAGLPTRGFTGKATWYRIFLPELLPDLDRVLCLDVDLIAMDELGPLYSTDLGHALVGAVTNVLAPMYMGRPAALGLDPLAYFNAGVMLLNL